MLLLLLKVLLALCELDLRIVQELLSKFRDKKVDFAAHTQTEDGGAVFFNLLGESPWLARHLLQHPGQKSISLRFSITWHSWRILSILELSILVASQDYWCEFHRFLVSCLAHLCSCQLTSH